MAQRFTLDTTDKVTVTNPHTLGAGSELTYISWAKLNGTPGSSWNSTAICGRGNGALAFLTFFDFGVPWDFTIPRDTTAATSEYETAALWNGTDWTFHACTYSEGNGCRVYQGTLTTAPVLLTPDANEVGSGDTTSESADFHVGARNSGSLAIDADIAVTHYFSEELTLNQIIAQWQRAYVRATTEFLFHHYKVGNQADYSGKGNNGTTIGTAIADHAPISPQFGFDTAPSYSVVAATSAVLGRPLVGPFGGPLVGPFG